MEHAAEFRRCLLELDVPGIRRLFRETSPHLHQPVDDAEALRTIHEARVRMATLPPRLRAYSEAWLAEHAPTTIAHAVGIAVMAPPQRQTQAITIRSAMERAVGDAIAAGVDLATESAEVRRRMMAARERA